MLCRPAWFQRFVCIVVVVLCLVVGGGNGAIAATLPTAASDAPPASEPAAPSLPSLDADSIPSERINQFVRAYLQVIDLIERRSGEMDAAETEAESLRIQQEITTEAFSIIENGGLTRQEYLQLLSLANLDPEFGERVAAQLQELK